MSVTKFTADGEPDRESARKGANLIDRGADLSGVGLFLTTATGKRIHEELPAILLRAVQALLRGFAEKGEVLVVNSEEEMSPEEAAKVLGISRPIVYQRMDAGKLPFREVGTHRRVLLTDVLQLKEAEDRRRRFAAALGADTEDLEANYAKPGQGAR
jgi:excisionase family DNA binding protein